MMLQILFAASLALPLTATTDRQPIAWEVRVQAATAGTIDAKEPFGAVALSWSGDPVAVRLRVSDHGVVWSEWIPAGIDQHLTDTEQRRSFTSIVHAGAASRYLEYSFDPADARAGWDVVITFFPLAIQTDPRPVISAPLSVGSVPIRSRLEWECPDGEQSRWTPAYTTVTHAVVHHTAGANSVADWDAEVRNIWYFHTVSRGWGDIGYNYLIDPSGVIYEGRAGGPGAIGAHFSCRNTNTVGISLLGTFTTVIPTPAALDALTRLLAELSKMHRIKPDSFAYHTPTALNLPAIPGHRDANASPQACSSTECPGDAFYAYLPAIRSEVATCPPLITTQPASARIKAGQSVTLSMSATGSQPFGFQWFSISGDTETMLEGSTAATVTVSPAVTTSYRVRVTNRCGIAASETAVVMVGSPRQRTARRGD